MFFDLQKLISVLGLAVLCHGYAVAYYVTYTYKIYAASVETTNFVRGVLHDLDIRKPADVFIAKGGDADSGAVRANFLQELSNPRIITVHEESFKKLSDRQKRFVVARAVLGEQSAQSLWRKIEVQFFLFGSWTASLIAFRGFYAHVLAPWRQRFVEPGESLMFGFLPATAVSILLLCYLERVYCQSYDTEAGIFCGDVASAITLVEAEQKKYVEDYPRHTIWGRFVRGVGRLSRPFKWSPTIEKRLQYMRELAQEQATAV